MIMDSQIDMTTNFETISFPEMILNPELPVQ